MICNQEPNESNVSSENNTIIINDNCIPDENEINYQITLYRINKDMQNKKKEEEDKRNLLKNQNLDFEMNFDEICKNNPAILALISSQKNDNSINLIPDIITLIKTNDKYKNYPNDKLSQKLVLYINSLKKKRPLEITDIKINDIENNGIELNDNNEINEKLSLIPENENVYERLYNRRKKFKLEINESKSEKNDSFSKGNIPKKTLEYLNKLSANETYIRNKTPNNQIKKIEIKSNSKSNYIIYNKYKNQFEKEIEELNKNNLIKNLDRLSYDEFLLFMKKLGFVREKNYDNEILLLNKIFGVLSNNYKTNIISINHLFIFTLSILNISECYKNEKIIVNQNHKRSLSLSSTSSSSTRNKGNLLFKFPTLKLNPIQSKKIFKEYMSLNYNWKNNILNNNNLNNLNNNILENNESKKLKNSNSNKIIKINRNHFLKSYLKTEDATYHPKTNIKYNKNIKGNLFTHIAQNNNRKILNNAILYKERERIEKKECTFKPKIIKYNNNNNHIKSKYNKSFISVSHSNKTNDEIEFENNFKEYTFKPDISLSKNYSKKNFSFKRKKSNNSSILNTTNSIKNEDNENKYIERLENGRKEREMIRSKKMLRNYSYDCFKKNNFNEIKYSKNKIKFDNSMFNEKGVKPLFVLDVNLNDNQKKRILIYKEQNVDETVQTFVKENNIDEKYFKFIKNLIIKEMKKFK